MWFACQQASRAADIAAQRPALAAMTAGQVAAWSQFAVQVCLVLIKNLMGGFSRYASLGKLCLNSISFVS